MKKKFRGSAHMAKGHKPIWKQVRIPTAKAGGPMRDKSQYVRTPKHKKGIEHGD